MIRIVNLTAFAVCFGKVGCPDLWKVEKSISNSNLDGYILSHTCCYAMAVLVHDSSRVEASL